MFDLDTIHRLNSEADALPGRDCSLGYHVSDNHDGRIKIVDQLTGDVTCVDASNPLDDCELVAFHGSWAGPRYVAAQVEALASQHRRIVVCEAGNPVARRERLEQIKANPYSAWAVLAGVKIAADLPRPKLAVERLFDVVHDVAINRVTAGVPVPTGAICGCSCGDGDCETCYPKN